MWDEIGIWLFNRDCEINCRYENWVGLSNVLFFVGI